MGKKENDAGLILELETKEDRNQLRFQGQGHWGPAVGSSDKHAWLPVKGKAQMGFPVSFQRIYKIHLLWLLPLFLLIFWCSGVEIVNQWFISLISLSFIFPANRQRIKGKLHTMEERKEG